MPDFNLYYPGSEDDSSGQNPLFDPKNYATPSTNNNNGPSFNDIASVAISGFNSLVNGIGTFWHLADGTPNSNQSNSNPNQNNNNGNSQNNQQPQGPSTTTIVMAVVLVVLVIAVLIMVFKSSQTQTAA